MCLWSVFLCITRSFSKMQSSKVRKYGSRRGNSTPQFSDSVSNWVELVVGSFPCLEVFSLRVFRFSSLSKNQYLQIPVLKTAASDALVFLFLCDEYILFNTCCVSICSMYYLQRLLISFYTVLLTGVVQTPREKHNVYAC